MDYHFEKGKFTEAELEQAIIELFTVKGYTYVHGENIHRQYEDILLFTRIGTCQPKPEHMEMVQKALKILGFCTRVVNRNGRDYLAPGERQIKKQRNKEDERLR